MRRRVPLASIFGLADGSDAQQMALKQINAIVHRQGVVMAFADVFLVLTALFVGLAVLSVLIKRPPANAPAGGGH